MKVLMLGGTRFIGRQIVGACLAGGDDVTVLHRGRSPSPFAGIVRHVQTDRRDLTPAAATVLAERWDAVIDTSARDPADLRPVLSAFREVGSYVFTSTCGVYRRRPSCPPLTERSPTIAADTSHPARASAVGKLRCERHLRRTLRRETRLLIARLGLVVGRHDDSERFTYWLERALRGGDVLVPMDAGQPIQLIDAVDAARFLRHVVGQGMSGLVNVAGPRITARTFIDTVLAGAEQAAITRWVGEEFALVHGVKPWTEIPLWLPASSPERALMSVETARAETAGLICRPFDDTVADSLGWYAERRTFPDRWLNPARERHLLQHWRG